MAKRQRNSAPRSLRRTGTARQTSRELMRSRAATWACVSPRPVRRFRMWPPIVSGRSSGSFAFRRSAEGRSVAKKATRPCDHATLKHFFVLLKVDGGASDSPAWRMWLHCVSQHGDRQVRGKPSSTMDQARSIYLYARCCRSTTFFNIGWSTHSAADDAYGRWINSPFILELQGLLSMGVRAGICCSRLAV